MVSFLEEKELKAQISMPCGIRENEDFLDRSPEKLVQERPTSMGRSGGRLLPEHGGSLESTRHILQSVTAAGMQGWNSWEKEEGNTMAD